jgi:hypothetical protein
MIITVQAEKSRGEHSASGSSMSTCCQTRLCFTRIQRQGQSKSLAWAVRIEKRDYFLSQFYIKINVIILPRQARDTHRKSSKNSTFFLGIDDAMSPNGPTEAIESLNFFFLDKRHSNSLCVSFGVYQDTLSSICSQRRSIVILFCLFCFVLLGTVRRIGITLRTRLRRRQRWRSRSRHTR